MEMTRKEGIDAVQPEARTGSDYDVYGQYATPSGKGNKK
jgi:hypothetical protein